MADATTGTGLGAGLVAADGARSAGHLAAHRAALSLEALGPELERGAQEVERRRQPLYRWMPDFDRPGEQKRVEIPGWEPDVQHLAQLEGEWVGYESLSAIQAADPELAAGVWERILAQARQEVTQGHAAARAIEGPRGRPIDRARFLALRESLAAEWQPRGATEQLLLDNLTQATMMRQRFLALAHHYEEAPGPPSGPCTPQEEREREQAWAEECQLPPRVTHVEAIDRAIQMAERFDRMATRAIRALRDLRRQTIFIQNEAGGQVNVAQQQQVNNPMKER